MIKRETDLRQLRAAVGALMNSGDPVIWEVLGLKLAAELAEMEATGRPLSEGLRYPVYNIDGCIRSYQLIKAMAG